MESFDRLKGRVVGLDTSPFIYYIERRDPLLGVVRPLFEAIHAGELTAVTSIVSLIELLVVPLRSGRDDLVARYRRLLLRAKHLRTLALDEAIAARAAELRARYNVGVPDAVQIAAALHAGAAAFVTNDDALRRVTDIEVLLLRDLVP